MVRPLAALLVLSVILWAPLMRGPIDLRWDAGEYYLLGTSLAHGNGYRILSEPGNPQAVTWPPILPLLVAAHERVLGTDNPAVVGKWLKVTFALMLAAAVAATYLLTRRWFSLWQAFTVGLIYLLSLHTYFLASSCFAEIPFTLVTLIFFLPRRHGWKSELGTGACAIAAFLLRTIGIALLATWVAESLLQRRWKRASMRAAIALVPVLLWQGYIHRVQVSEAYQHPAYPYQRALYQFYNVPYIDNLRLVDQNKPELGKWTPTQMLERVARNLKPLALSLGEAVSYHWQLQSIHRRPIKLAADAMIYGFSALVLVGLLLLGRRGESSIIIYLAFSVLLIIYIPLPSMFGRYLTPLVPFLAAALMQVLVWASQQLGRWKYSFTWRMASAGLVALAGLAVMSELVNAAAVYVRPDDLAYYTNTDGTEHEYRLIYYGKEWRDFDSTVEWLRRHAQSGTIVANWCPELIYLKIQHKAVMPPMEVDVNTAQRLLDSVPVTYLLIDDLAFMPTFRDRFILPVVLAHPERWKKVYEVPGTWTSVYQRTGARSAPRLQATE